MKESGIYLTEDGSHSYVSGQFGESYHSRHGAIQESQHVFIEAGLQQKSNLGSVSILEMGFGTGLNAFMTLLEAIRLQKRVSYLGIEAYPIPSNEVKKLNFSVELNAGAYQDLFYQMHEAKDKEEIAVHPNFHFEKRIADVAHLSFYNQFDLVYFDAFAPSAQPELWDRTVLSKMYDALKPGGILVTYCAKGEVKRTLKAVGFKIEAIPGPPGKREMTRAVRI